MQSELTNDPAANTANIVCQPVVDHSRIESRPVYQPVEKSEQALLHLFVFQNEMPQAMTTVFNQIGDNPQLDKTSLSVKDSADAQQALTPLLATMPLASTVYLAGDEAFIWQTASQLKTAGLQFEQIKLFEPEVKTRQVFCCHCYHITPDVQHSPTTCGGCQRPLAVTDHFSRQHGAYFAYQANAEDPNDLPDVKELS